MNDPNEGILKPHEFHAGDRVTWTKSRKERTGKVLRSLGRRKDACDEEVEYEVRADSAEVNELMTVVLYARALTRLKT